ncbi:hypothetical protein STRCI_003595 [Streptomyces cinnabarinus]|uniref:Uncharacterized protein n=1 Tax=Streptomyces cinnabarinus TaxID=67287 RepID=A0ABY7KF94_9ACTN|nr:hypothetical protein [Streptomyces cinnabarinus]WAZ22345.1 hypothetical protein STRCI_003595 [Streptomyces cinnabarinus]
MRGGTPGGELLSPVEISAASVQRGDVIQVGGQQYRVADIFQLPNGAKRLVFDSGEWLTLHTRTRLIALRLLRVRGGDPSRALSSRRYRA